MITAFLAPLLIDGGISAIWSKYKHISFALVLIITHMIAYGAGYNRSSDYYKGEIAQAESRSRAEIADYRSRVDAAEVSARDALARETALSTNALTAVDRSLDTIKPGRASPAVSRALGGLQ